MSPSPSSSGFLSTPPDLPPTGVGDYLLLAIIFGIVLVTVYAPWATLSCWRIYFADKRTKLDELGKVVPDRSRILLLFAWISSIVTGAMLISAYLALRRLFGLEALDYGAHLLGIAIIALGLIPYLIDRTMRRIRNIHGDGTPPPFGEKD